MDPQAYYLSKSGKITEPWQVRLQKPQLFAPASFGKVMCLPVPVEMSLLLNNKETPYRLFVCF